MNARLQRAMCILSIMSISHDLFVPASAPVTSGAMGAVLATVYATTFNNRPTCDVTDPECWRFTFVAVAVISLVIGLCTLRFATDPFCPAGQLRPVVQGKPARGDSMSGSWSKTAAVADHSGAAWTPSSPEKGSVSPLRQPLLSHKPSRESCGGGHCSASLPWLDSLLTDDAASNGTGVMVGFGSEVDVECAPGAGGSFDDGSSAEPWLVASPLTRHSLMETLMQMLTMPTFLIIVLQVWQWWNRSGGVVDDLSGLGSDQASCVAG